MKMQTANTKMIWQNTSNEHISNQLAQTSLTGTLGSFGAADSTDDDKLPVGLFDI